MAGTYTDPPDHRMAYDRDGSVATWINMAAGSVIRDLTAQELAAINDESGQSTQFRITGINGVTNAAVALIFPELRDVTAHRLQGRALQDFASLKYSTDTTNGVDGTWTSFPSDGMTSDTTKADLRTSVPVNLVAVKALRFHGSGGSSTSFGIFNWHIYGRPAAGQAPDRLRFWDPTLAEEVGGAHFDWGDIARGSSVSRDFRIHNPSAALTANGVVVSMEALTDTSPANTSQHEFSVDGGLSWATTATLGDLAPGATSGVITLRRITSASAVLSLWWTRMVASAASWS